MQGARRTQSYVIPRAVFHILGFGWVSWPPVRLPMMHRICRFLHNATLNALKRAGWDKRTGDGKLPSASPILEPDHRSLFQSFIRLLVNRLVVLLLLLHGSLLSNHTP